MSIPIFPNGIRGLSDSKWSGAQGEAHKLVGVDFRSEPRVVKAHQKLDKISSVIENDKEVDVVDELCNSVVTLDDGNRVWFSSESGKIWKQDPSDNFSLLHTLDVANDYKEPDSTRPLEWEDEDIMKTLSIYQNGLPSNYSRQNDSIEWGGDYHNHNAGRETMVIPLGSNGMFANLHKKMVNRMGSVVLRAGDVNNQAGKIVFHEEFDLYDRLEIDAVNPGFVTINPSSDTPTVFMGHRKGNDYRVDTFTFSPSYNDFTHKGSLIHGDGFTWSPTYNLVERIDDSHILYLSRDNLKVFETFSPYTTITEKSTALGKSRPNFLMKVRDDCFIVGSNFNLDVVKIGENYSLSYGDNFWYNENNTAGKDARAVMIDESRFVVSSANKEARSLCLFELNELDEISLLDSLVYEHEDFGPETHPKPVVLIGKNTVAISSVTTNKQRTESEHEIKIFEIIDNKIKERIPKARNTEKLRLAVPRTQTMVKIKDRLIVTIHGTDSEKDDYEEIHWIKSFTITTGASVGVTLNPTDKEPEIVKAFASTEGHPSREIETKLEVPENINNSYLLVVTGSSENNKIRKVEVEGVEADELVSLDEDYWFGSRYSIYGIKNPESGENTIKTTFTEDTRSRFIATILISNISQTTPTGETDSGWLNYLVLEGNKNNQLRVGAFLTRKGPQITSGDHQEGVISTDIKSGDIFYTLTVDSRLYQAGTDKIINAKMFSYEELNITATEENEYEYSKNEMINEIFFCNDNVLFRIKDKDIDDWAEKMETVDNFKHGSDQHSMVVQNSELFISDKHSIAKVSRSMEFLPEVFGGLEPEEITSLTSFDTDILIGTKNGNQARVLRWDCFDRGYYAQDEIFEKGVNTFIKDDNYTYVSVGETGKLYYYNGEKLDLFKRIDGGWDKNNTAIIHDNSVTTFNGIPLFGLSTKNGTPTEMGLYGLGSYSNRYPKSLSLDFPVPTSELDNVKIGAMTVRDCDLYVSYKTETDVGIAKLNHNKKYPNAYIETTMLTDLRERGVGSIIEGVTAEYVELPEDTDVKIGSKTKYDDDYVDMDTVIDTGKMLVGTKNNIPNISNLQLRFELLSKDNDSPVIENFSLC